MFKGNNQGRLLIVIVLLFYLALSIAFTWSKGPSVSTTPTRTPRPTFAEVQPGLVAQGVLPTATRRVLAASTQTPTGVRSSPAASPVPIATDTATATATPTSRLVSTPTQTPSPAPVVHVVTAGENLTGIARQYGTTIQAITQANGLSNPEFLYVGQKLTIPLSDQPWPATATPSPATITHVVSAGETLSGIALEYGVALQTIVDANGLANPELIYVNQVLVIPLPAQP